MQIPTAVEGSLNKKCKSMLRELCMKYDSPANVDRLLSVQSKVRRGEPWYITDHHLFYTNWPVELG